MILIEKYVRNPIFLVLLFQPILFIIYKIEINSFFYIIVEVSIIFALLYSISYFVMLNKKEKVRKIFQGKKEVFFMLIAFLLFCFFNILGWYINILNISDIRSSLDFVKFCLNFIYLILHLIFLIFFFHILNTGKIDE